MNRHKKTRQQKIISQLRHQLNQKEPTLSFSPTVTTPPSLSRSLPTNPPLSAVLSAKALASAEALAKAENPPFVVTTTISRDLFKTTIITATIISLELILYFLLERR